MGEGEVLFKEGGGQLGKTFFVFFVHVFATCQSLPLSFSPFLRNLNPLRYHPGVICGVAWRK